MTKPFSKIEVRPTRLDEDGYLKQWLLEPGVLRWFPMENGREIEDAVRLWISFAEKGSCLTVECNGVPCGMATLYIQPYKKLAHQCLMSIIVSEQYRNRGVGTVLTQNLMALAQEKFGIELIHLEVYEGNPAIHLYQKMGFERYGCQTHFIKERGVYIGKILMQRVLNGRT